MDEQPHRASRPAARGAEVRWIGLSAIPLLLAAATLLDEWLAPYRHRQGWRIAALACLVALPVVLALTARARGVSVLASRLIAAPALLAPVSVCFPWAAVPSHLGVAFGELPLFLEWLTRYPNRGSINVEVLLGILCILGCAFLPWLSAALLLSHRSSRPTHAVLLALVLIPYIPVAIQLDLRLLATGLLMKDSPFQPAPPIWVAFGAMIRLTAILSIVGTMLYDGTARDWQRENPVRALRARPARS